MAKQLTIRGVPDEVGRRLELLSREGGQSVNSTVLRILDAAVGYEERRKRLESSAIWSDEERLEFEAALSSQRTVDDGDWA